MAQEAPNIAPNPLTRDPEALGQVVRSRRAGCQLRLDDTAHACGVSTSTLSRLENGRLTRADNVFKILDGLGLAMLVMPRTEADALLRTLGHTVEWRSTPGAAAGGIHRPRASSMVRSTTPTLFVDYDGTLHVGHALLDTTSGQVGLDSGRPLLEFAPLLADLLEPYPEVEIVLTTSWLQRLSIEQVASYLPKSLARRVVATTRAVKPRLSYVLDGTERTYIITSYAYDKGLKNWLAIDDSVYGADHVGLVPGELMDHFLLLDSARGISDEGAQQRIRDWLANTHEGDYM